MNPHVNGISGRLSLRQPQRRSLEILDRITEISPPKKAADLAAALAAPEIDPETGDPIPLVADIASGCDLRAATCATKFGNLPNFGGFPEIPGRNPFGGSSIV